MSKRFVFVLACLFPCLVQATPGSEWRYRDVIQLIENRAAHGRPIDSVESLLDAFPPELKRYSTFVFETQNKFQAADPLHPRALVFNRYLIYAFNGHPSQRGFDTVEFMELDEANRKLELREIEFVKTAKGKEARYSTSTPAKCLQCHGASPRPIWAQYSLWPGVYGTNDDEMSIGQENHFKRFRFEAQTEPNSRYARLDFPAGSELSPYSDRISGYKFRINLLFSKLITRFDGERILGAAAKSPYFETFKWALPVVSREYSCRLPDDLEAPFDARVAEAFRRSGLKLPKDARRTDLLFMLWGFPVTSFSPALGAREFYYSDGATPLVKRITDPLLLDLAREVPELDALLERKHEYTPIHYEAYELYEWMDGHWPTVFPRSCKFLNDKIRASLATPLPDVPAAPSAQSFEAKLQQAEEHRASSAVPISCVFCHTVEKDAPRIAFDDEAKLAVELTAEDHRLLDVIAKRVHADSSPKLRMPPPGDSRFEPLSTKESEALAKYLSDLTRLKLLRK